MNKSCVVCKSIENKIVFIELGINVLRCMNCGHVYSSFAIEQNYAGYFGDKPIESENQFWWNEAHSEMYDDFCSRFTANKKGKLLDVGCGLGYFVKKVSAFSSWQVFGYEISQHAVAFAKEKLGLQNIFCGKVEDSNFDKNSFDIITLWDVIEHIPNPGPLLSYLSSLLNNGGILFIHTPNIEIQLPKAKLKKILSWAISDGHYLEAMDHLNIYSPKTMTMVLHRKGFKKIEFIHLRPIQSVSGSRSQILKFVKSLWFYSSVLLFYCTFGRVNLDNLFIVARK